MPEEYIKIFLDRSVLVGENGEEELFPEGRTSAAARRRLRALRDAFEAGFLPELIESCRALNVRFEEPPQEQMDLFEEMVESVNSQRGRAIIGLTVLQLCIKCICPDQSVRLHKGGRGRGFSWQEGLPMRAIDSNYITPVLREYGLLKVNKYGVFMTRSLAENYPYTNLYKAALRGAKDEWISIVELLEDGAMNPHSALCYLISLLINRSDRFQEFAQEALGLVMAYIANNPSYPRIRDLIKAVVDKSDYSARVFEIALHSLFQVMESHLAFDGYLKPLSQMRSANKKHGDIGDIEITIGRGTLEIQESWDAKYGKPYLREELEELNDKLEDHPETRLAGFIVDGVPDLRDEIASRKRDIEECHEVAVPILNYEAWCEEQIQRVDINRDVLAREWLQAFAESLCQQRRHIAPIDEPSSGWIEQLRIETQDYIKHRIF